MAGDFLKPANEQRRPQACGAPVITQEVDDGDYLKPA